MKQRYIDYALYNIWANDRLIKDLLRSDAALLDKEVKGSFPSIRAILSHMWYAETGWLARMNGHGWQVARVTNFTGNSEELLKAWQETSEEFKNYVNSSDLEQLISFEHKGESFSIPAREIMQTVLNHGSYHRGQVVLLMRQLGVSTITQTDYIEWVREKERGNIKTE